MMKNADPSWRDIPEARSEEGSPASAQNEEPVVSAAGAAQTANRAINETAGKYLGATGLKIDLENLQGKIRDRPLFYLTIAAGAGFVIGGGMASKWELALLGLAGRRAAAETATNFGRQMLRNAFDRTRASA